MVGGKCVIRIRTEYQEVEEYMFSCMTESMFIVFCTIPMILLNEGITDEKILKIACLLHDIGREEQYSDLTVDQAKERYLHLSAEVPSSWFD